MRRTLAMAALGLVLLTASACTKDTPEAPTGSPSVSVSASDSPATPGPSGSVATGSAELKVVCATLTAKTTAWAKDFGVSATDLLKLGNDKAKITAAVKNLKDATAKLATEVRVEGAKAKDPALVRASANLAAALDKVNASLTVESVTKDPNSAITAFEDKDFVESSEALAKVCGA